MTPFLLQLPSCCRTQTRARCLPDFLPGASICAQTSRTLHAFTRRAPAQRGVCRGPPSQAVVGTPGVRVGKRDGGEVKYRHRRVQGVLERPFVGVCQRQRQHEHHGQGLERCPPPAAGRVDTGELREVSEDRKAP